MPEEAKVYIGNIPYSVTEDEIRHAFDEYGRVEDVNIIIDRQNQRSKGFAFVTYEHSDDARDAIKGLDQTQFMGRCINVQKSRDNRGGGGGRQSYGGESNGRDRSSSGRDRSYDRSGRSSGRSSGGGSSGRRYNDNSGGYEQSRSGDQRRSRSGGRNDSDRHDY